MEKFNIKKLINFQNENWKVIKNHARKLITANDTESVISFSGVFFDYFPTFILELISVLMLNFFICNLE